MKSKYFIFNVFILLMLLLSLIPAVSANPIAIGPDLPDLFYLLVVLPNIFFFTIVIEFVVIYLFLRNHGIEHFKLTKPVIAVNLLSFPITQIIVLLFMKQFSSINGFIYLVELFPITLECFLYLKIFNYYNKLEYFELPVSAKKTVITSITANSITFSIGLLVSLTQLFNLI